MSDQDRIAEIRANNIRKQYLRDTCENGRIHDGNGYDRGQCSPCGGKGCPDEMNYRTESINPDVAFLLAHIDRLQAKVEAMEKVVEAARIADRVPSTSNMIGITWTVSNEHTAYENNVRWFPSSRGLLEVRL